MSSIDIFVLVCLVLAGLFTVMTASLLRAGIGLMITSAVLTIILFRLNMPLAAVFELSVCAGLIPVIFITVISLTKPLRRDEALAESKEKLHRFWALPFIIAALAALLVLLNIRFNIPVPQAMNALGSYTQRTMWLGRQLDVVGQIIILLAGAIGIQVLFKERKKK